MKKLLSYPFLLALLAAACMTFTACGDDDPTDSVLSPTSTSSSVNSSLVGNWIYTFSSGYQILMLNSDGTYREIEYDNGKVEYDEKGKYTYNVQSSTLRLEEDTEGYTYNVASVNEQQLILIDPYDNRTYTYNRYTGQIPNETVTPDPQPNPNPDPTPDPTNSYDKYAVDLGLSVKWASVNVGSTTESGSGTFYSWGYTTPYSTSDKVSHTSRDISGTSNDVAHVTWGGKWRMPTSEECEELFSKCTLTWTTKGGIKGVKVSRNGNSIFLPAGGYQYYGSLTKVGTGARIWSSTCNGYHLYLNYEVADQVYSGIFYGTGEEGMPVRPVRE